MIRKIIYKIDFPDSEWPSSELAERFSLAENFPVFWSKKNRNVDLRAFVDSLSVEDGSHLKMVLRSNQEGLMRPEEALDFIFGWTENQRPTLTIQKVLVQFKESESCPTKS
jgi:hypothetical protein